MSDTPADLPAQRKRQEQSTVDKATLHIAVAQIPVSRDVSANTDTISSAIDCAAGEHAEVLLTPEGSVSGYTHQFDQSQVERGARATRKQGRLPGSRACPWNVLRRTRRRPLLQPDPFLR